MPAKYIGSVMELLKERRGDYRGMEYFIKEEVQSSETGGALRVMLKYDVPLSELIIDFYDQLKSRTQGYASMDYSFAAYLPAELVKLEILINSQPVDAFSLIVPRERAYRQGRELVTKLRKLIPRQNFEVAIQAAIGSKVIVRETIKPFRKDVIAKCYGGDITRKRKLLAKQAEGKKKMKMVGRVEIPPEAFIEVLRI
jgi:GTP-binding protein LepA